MLSTGSFFESWPGPAIACLITCSHIGTKHLFQPTASVWPELVCAMITLMMHRGNEDLPHYFEATDAQGHPAEKANALAECLSLSQSAAALR